MFAVDGSGIDQSKSITKIFGAVLPGMSDGLGNGVFHADDGAGQGNFSLLGNSLGQGVGLIVSTENLARPIEGDGNQPLGVIQQTPGARFLQKPIRQNLRYGPAMVIFHVVNEFSKGFSKWAQSHDFFEGVDTLAEAVRAGCAKGQRRGAMLAAGFGGQVVYLRPARGAEGGVNPLSGLPADNATWRIDQVCDIREQGLKQHTGIVPNACDFDDILTRWRIRFDPEGSGSYLRPTVLS